MKINSVRFKVSILFSGFLFLILMGFSVFKFSAIRQILYQDQEEELVAKAKRIENSIDVYAEISSKDQLWNKNIFLLNLQNEYYQIMSFDGKVLFHSNNMNNEIEQLFIAQFSPLTTKLVFRKLHFNKENFLAINYLIKYTDQKLLILQLATPLATTQKILTKLRLFDINGVAIIILMTFFMGSMLARRMLKHVADIARVTKEISQTNLSQRIPIKKVDQEMVALVDSINQMIDRLEKSFAYIHEFNSHVAHELKTPLAIIKSELELAIDAGNSKEENERVITDSLQEVNRLIKVIKDMLLLAKFEYKVGIFKMEEIIITEFLQDIYQHSKVLAMGRDIKFEFAPLNQLIRIKGDSIHLRRIFLNLINNAIKFTPNGGQINIFTEISKEHVFIFVQDTGIGIAFADQPRIFEGFFRVRQINQEESESNGLGLSMARVIARAHGGDITFESEAHKGSVFKVSLPRLLE